MSINRTAVVRGAALAAIAGMIFVPTAAAASDSNELVDISVTIPAVDPGQFTWSVPSSLTLGTAVAQGTYLEVTSSGLVVQVTDTRLGAPGWSISGQATQFERTDGGAVFSSAYLGWRPEITQSGAGATAGPEAPSGYDPATPLNPIDSAERGLNLPKVLASATTGHGGDMATTAEIVGHLTLRVPVSTAAGDYDSVLSLTATLGG